MAADQARVGVPFEFKESVGPPSVDEVTGAVEMVTGVFDLRRLPTNPHQGIAIVTAREVVARFSVRSV